MTHLAIIFDRQRYGDECNIDAYEIIAEDDLDAIRQAFEVANGESIEDLNMNIVPQNISEWRIYLHEDWHCQNESGFFVHSVRRVNPTYEVIFSVI